MKCPSCINHLNQFSVLGIKVLGCQGGCGGLWFPCQEIKKIPSRPVASGTTLLNLKKADGVRVYRNVEHICPQCQSTLLFRHFFSKKHGLEVDQCSKCGGVWIDIEKIHLFSEQVAEDPRENPENLKNLKKIVQEKMNQMNTSHPDMMEAWESIRLIFSFILAP